MIVPASTWNNAISAGGGDAVIQMTASSAVNSSECGSGSYVSVDVSYPAPAYSEDTNGDDIPDECSVGGACSIADVTTTGAGTPGTGVSTTYSHAWFEPSGHAVATVQLKQRVTHLPVVPKNENRGPSGRGDSGFFGNE